MTETAWFLVFWVFLLGLGTIEYLIEEDHKPAVRLRRWPANIALGVANGLILSILPITLVTLAELSENRGWGTLHALDVPFWIAAVVAVLARDGAQFLFHRLSHAWPLLWRFHAVHHSDPHIDVSTGLRFHPGEYIANLLFIAPFVVVLGLPATALAVFEIVTLIYGLFCHTSLALPRWIDAALRPVLITPALHKVHHSVLRSDHDRNFGVIFSFWDRLMGTYKSRSDAAGGVASLGLDLPQNHALDPLKLWFPRMKG